MKRTIHRSITFWSGILVMAFICWAWWDSKTNQVWMLAGKCNAISRHSALEILFNPDFADWNLQYRRESSSMFEESLFQEPFVHSGSSALPESGDFDPFASNATNRDYALHFLATGRPDAWTAYIPHWLLLLAFAIPWSALLLWRARRRKRALDHSTPPV